MEVPDYIGALFTHLRADASTVALAGTRISGSMDKWQGMPTYGVLALATGGNDQPDIAHILPRVDLWCYGPNRYEAMRLWRTVQGYLMRVDGGIVSFKVGTTAIFDVMLESGPEWLPEADSNYPRVVGSYILRVAAVPL